METPVTTTMPRASGLGRKTVGRVAPVTNIRTNGTPSKTAGYIRGVSGPLELEAPAEHTKEASFRRLKNIGVAAGTAAGTAIAGAALAGAGSHLFNAVKVRLIDKPEFERSFRKALEINPSLRSYPEDELRSYFDLVCQASPTVARNPLLVSQYLKHLVSYSGSMNFNAFNELVKLEGQIIKNDEGSNKLTGIAEKALIETTIKDRLGRRR